MDEKKTPAEVKDGALNAISSATAHLTDLRDTYPDNEELWDLFEGIIDDLFAASEALTDVKLPNG